MKLLIITSIKEDLQAVSNIMEKAGISVFSVTDIIGHKSEQHDYMPDNWFGKTGTDTDALMFISFTDTEKASIAIKLVTQFNTSNKTGFPVRAFVMPVEQWGN